MQQISTVEELQRELDAAGDRVVVVEMMADGVCETGLQEADDGWTPDRAAKDAAKLAVCEGIKHSFMRMAADSPSARFLEALVRGPLLCASAHCCSTTTECCCSCRRSCTACLFAAARC